MGRPLQQSPLAALLDGAAQRPRRDDAQPCGEVRPVGEQAAQPAELALVRRDQDQRLARRHMQARRAHAVAQAQRGQPVALAHHQRVGIDLVEEGQREHTGDRAVEGLLRDRAAGQQLGREGGAVDGRARGHRLLHRRRQIERVGDRPPATRPPAGEIARRGCRRPRRVDGRDAFRRRRGQARRRRVQVPSP